MLAIDKENLIKVVEENHLDVDYILNRDKFDDFVKRFIRTFDEVVQHNIDYYKISCPREFLDEKEIVAMDNDYEFLYGKYYLEVEWFYESVDDLIEEEIIIERPYTYRTVDGQENIEVYYGTLYDCDDVYIHIIDPDAPYGQSSYFKISVNGLSNEMILDLCRRFLPNCKEGI